MIKLEAQLREFFEDNPRVRLSAFSGLNVIDLEKDEHVSARDVDRALRNLAMEGVLEETGKTECIYGGFVIMYGLKGSK